MKQIKNKITFDATIDELQEFITYIYNNIYFDEKKGFPISKLLYKILADLNSTFIHLKDYDTVENYALLQEINGDLKDKIKKLEKQNKNNENKNNSNSHSSNCSCFKCEPSFVREIDLGQTLNKSEYAIKLENRKEKK